MKRVVKLTSSEAINLVYKNGNSKHNKEIRDILIKEQEEFCAYCESSFKHHAVAEEVEHFNNTIKGNDDYYNYYAVCRKCNTLKQGKSYNQYPEGVINPSDKFLENRITYFQGEYFSVKKDDSEVNNLLDFTSINNEKLTDNRIKYIVRLRELFEINFSKNIDNFIDYLIRHKDDEVRYRTAIKAEFGIEL